MTLVTATVRDPAGNIYANALVVASFIGQSTVPGAGPYTAGGVPQGQFETVVPGNTDSFGVLSLPITGNDIITPSPSTWRWTVVSSTVPPVSFAVNIQITGANQDISAALQAAAAPLVTPTGLGNITALSLGVTGATTVTSITETSQNGIQIVGNGTNTTIQTAITAAGTTGSVMIPTSYAGIDSYTNPNGVSIIDLRNTHDPFSFRFGSILVPSYPVANAPLGNDLVLRQRGPADFYLEHLKAYTTTTDTINIGLNANVLISAVSVGDSSRGILQTGGAALLMNLTPTTGVVIIGRGTANVEQVTATLVDATHLSFTATKTHGGTTDIEEVGAMFLRQRIVIVDPVSTKPSQQTTAQMTWYDSQINIMFFTPGNIADPWPLGGMAFAAKLTGAQNAGQDHPVPGNLVIQNSDSSHSFLVNRSTGQTFLTVSDTAIDATNAAGTANLLALSESGGGAVLDLANPTNRPLRFNASSTVGGFVQGGGSSSLLALMGTQAGTGNSGTVGFYDNASDFNQNMAVAGGTGLISKYGKIATAGNGIASILSPVTSQKSETTADANVLTVTPPAVAGKYRVSFSLDVSAAAAAVLGWTITYKDSNGNAVAPTNLALTQLGAAAPALTFTTSVVSNYSGSVDITVDASATNIVVKFTLASGTITAKASATIERLI